MEQQKVLEVGITYTEADDMRKQACGIGTAGQKLSFLSIFKENTLSDVDAAISNVPAPVCPVSLTEVATT